MRLDGIDVSHHQGAIDWTIVAAVMSFAYIKATEGVGYIDPRYRSNAKAATEAGIMHGAYHFARVSPEPRDAEREADEFIEATGLYQHTLPPALDLEWSSVRSPMSPGAIVEWTLRWLDTVEAEVGVRPVVYTGPNFWRFKLARSTALRPFPLWMARYTKLSDAKARAYIEGWPTAIWQWTGEGHCPGIKGKVDRNVMFVDPRGATPEHHEPVQRVPLGPDPFPRRPPVAAAVAWVCDRLASPRM